ncbi:F-box protein PP2-B13 [Forsythia ovata]|uniref:F-box protein PP2-B13 n=1 Tax=Forsythia ovata TaxID=205694 RepID=A0ABD1PZ04_9LAMI
MACSNIKTLPEDCVSTILSLTSPQDVCRMLLVYPEVRPAADSDIVWERFLPCDCWDIVSRTHTPLKFSSKKELFFILSDSILIDSGNKAFALDKSSSLKSYILSARELSILYSDEGNNWSWKSIPESRFEEVAELKTSGRLQIQGTIRTQILSPNTTYAAYLLIKISDRAFGLDSIPCETSIVGGDRVLDTNTTYLRDPDSKRHQLENLFYCNRVQMMKGRVNEGDEKLPRKRKDGWLEIELGEFFTSESDEVVTMSLMEVKGHQLKGGLIIQGIEVRPKY